jgi:O-antigen/teichoic acid export membrane protein
MGIIVRQGIKNNIITYIGVLIGFFNILVLQPKVLTPEEFGLLRLLYSVSALFISLYPLGLTAFTIKYFPKMDTMVILAFWC